MAHLVNKSRRIEDSNFCRYFNSRMEQGLCVGDTEHLRQSRPADPREQMYYAVIEVRGIPSRRLALDWEKQYADELLQAGEPMRIHNKP